MEYSKIISVTGLPGLYELLNSKSDGAIVRSLDDKNTRFVSSRIHNFSHLESIEVYTSGDNVNLVEVFEAMEKSSEKLPDESDASGVKEYFQKVYGDIDFDRVYNSDMKKMVRWFNILKANEIEIKLPEPEELEPDPAEEEPEKIEEKKIKPKKTAKEKASKEPQKEAATKKSAKSEDTKTAAKTKKKEEKATPKKSAKKSAGKSAKKK
jgi:outer membrane biosynthesis protein TonB